MLKKEITYNNFDGTEETEVFYFNLTKAELIEIEMGHEGGLSEALKKIVASKDGAEIIKEFKSIILRSYGKRSPDGKRFIKNQQVRDEFESTEAFSVLFVELVTDTDAAAEFVRGIMPQDMMREAQMVMDSTPPESPFVPPQEPRQISRAEAESMDAAELQAGLASKSVVITAPFADAQALTAEEMEMMDVVDLARGFSSGRYKIAEES